MIKARHNSSRKKALLAGCPSFFTRSFWRWVWLGHDLAFLRSLAVEWVTVFYSFTTSLSKSWRQINFLLRLEIRYVDLWLGSIIRYSADLVFPRKLWVAQMWSYNMARFIVVFACFNWRQSGQIWLFQSESRITFTTYNSLFSDQTCLFILKKLDFPQKIWIVQNIGFYGRFWSPWLWASIKNEAGSKRRKNRYCEWVWQQRETIIGSQEAQTFLFTTTMLPCMAVRSCIREIL